MNDANRLIVWTDGSSLGNPGPAGWSWYVSEDCWAADGERHSTNNRMELQAVVSVLAVSGNTPLLICLDSSFVENIATKWRFGWARNGFSRTGSGKPIANVDLVRELHERLHRRDVAFRHVAAHTGVAGNERADTLARAAASAYKRGGQPERGPGFQAA